VGESAVANLHEREPRVSGLIARGRARSRLGCRLVYAFRPHYIARVKDSSDAMPSRFGTNQGLPSRRAIEGGDTLSPSYIDDFVSSEDGLRLIKAFVRIARPAVRYRIVNVVQEIAAAHGG
jgi:hypothetical protein